MLAEKAAHGPRSHGDAPVRTPPSTHPEHTGRSVAVVRTANVSADPLPQRQAWTPALTHPDSDMNRAAADGNPVNDTTSGADPRRGSLEQHATAIGIKGPGGCAAAS